jgi:ribosomal protein S18 acetylase RimI-like enzyme
METPVLFQDYAYSHSPAEFAELRELLICSYTVSRTPLNWRLAMLENWYYASRYLEPVEYFTSRVHLWRAASGQLVSFLIRYYNMTYLQVLPVYRWLEDPMLDWAEQNWPENKAQIDTLAYEYDHERLAHLKERNYQDQGLVEYVRIYDLACAYPEPVLPPGFQITTQGQHGRDADRVALENSIWNVSLTDAWFQGKSSAPSYSFDWDLLVVSPEDQPVAACLVWIDWRNRTAEIDPLGTHPAYRGRGLARALVTASFHRLHASGLDYVYIASEANNDIVNGLYQSLQPIETFRGHRWTKRLE